MEIFNQEFTQEIIRLTWRNPAFMAIAIALVWLIPQLFIRKIKFRSFTQLILLNKIFIYKMI